MITASPVREHPHLRVNLETAAALVEPSVRAAVDRLPDQEKAIAGYQFGWWDREGVPTPGNGGKGIRPALVLLSTAAARAAIEQAIGAAVSIELVHNFSLLHDDIMDGDIKRRSRPSAWLVYGKKAALLTGDALLVLAFDVLAESSGHRSVAAIQLLTQTLLELAEGQSMDLAFEGRDDVEILECLTMAGRKTASLTSYACAIGPCIAGVDPVTIRHLQGFGYHLGLAFQLMDDVIGIWGDEERAGKPVGSDLAARKKTLPVVAALTSTGSARDRLIDLYNRATPFSADDVRSAALLVEQLGGRAWAEAEMQRQVGIAVSHLRDASLEPAMADELATLVQRIIRRDR
ncbi:polyprenyl synthetase family protein [Pendulispora albinea]|uniref:Polyprenyl synthetase family protein n=1 Tax=Pendulispora albinea TaxID=2741071 RepID=A0ABZ2MAQ0_9BACT